MPTSPLVVRVLIVLGDPVLASTLTSALAHRRVQVVGPFSTVEDALIALLHRTHLVAILDLALPNAWALARTLEHWDVPYLILGTAEEDVGEAPLVPALALKRPIAPHDVFKAALDLALMNAPPSNSEQH